MSKLLVLIAFCCSIQLVQDPSAPPPAAKPDGPLSEAERITRQRESLERTIKAIAVLEKQLEDPDSEYVNAEREFQKLDKSYKEGQVLVEMLKAEQKVEEAAKQEMALVKLGEARKEARDRFDLAIAQRRAAQQALNALKQRLDQEQKLLDKLDGKLPPDPPTDPNGSKTAKEAPKPVEAPAPKPSVPSIPGIPGMPGLPSQSNDTEVTPPAAPKPTDAKVLEAQNALETQQQQLKLAEEKVQTVEERINFLKKAISSSASLLEAERATLDQVQATLARQTKTLQENPPEDFREREELAERIVDANDRIVETRVRIKILTDKLSALNEELHALEQERMEAFKEAEQRRQDTEAAGAQLAYVLNPFTTRNLLRWASSHGPNLIIIGMVTIGLYLLLRLLSRNIVHFVIRASHRGTEEDRENRASTLVGVFRYTVGILILGGGFVMLLDEAGIPIVPLMGGAAVLGLAVAFGAQNLIKDYFSGFMMLMEDQYGVNDVVRIGATAGLVEKITLRVTVLRDLEGIRHFIPHGSITQVSNMTHTWSRAMFDVPLAYGEDVDRAIKVLLELAREMRMDSEYSRYIIEDAEMLGVDALDVNAVIVKFLIKTRPLKQWLIKREMLRRIKNRFDEVGITIPIHQRTIFHKFPDGVPAIPIQ